MHQNNNEFNALADQIGLPNHKIANILSVRCDTVRRWRIGRRDVPPGVLLELREYIAYMPERI